MPLAYAFFLADVNTDVDAVNGVMSSLFQLSAYLLLMPLLVILASNLLFEELDNDTLKNLVTVPVNRTKLVLSKMLVLLLFAVGFMAVGGLVNLAVLLFQDDVIYDADGVVIVVNTPPCEVIEVSLAPGHEKYVAKVCYEIGNRHAPLFWGDKENTFITIYNEPMMAMLEKLHGVKAEKTVRKLDFDRRISAAIHNHHH